MIEDKKFKLENIQMAKIHFINYLKRQGYNILNILPKNENRYMFVETAEENFFFMFKRENLFYSYGKIFNDGNKAGETINAEDLRYCFKKNIKRIFVAYDNGNTYYQTPLFWAEKQNKRLNEADGKETYSIAVDDLIRFNYDQEKRLIA